MPLSQTSGSLACAPLLALLLLGCGEYAPAPGTGQGGTGAGGTSAQAGTGGSGQSGMGAGGSSGQAGAGGASSAGGAGGASASGGAGGGCNAAGAGGGNTAQLACPEPVPDATPCGGDVLGTWAATACPLTVTGQVDMAGLGLGCQSGEITSGSLQVTGTWTADTCGMISDNTRTTGEQEIELPPSCKMVSGFVTTCDRVSDPFGDTLGYASVTCVDNAETGGCTCSATIDQEGGIGFVSVDASASGMYTTADNTLTTTVFGTDTEYAYCVSGNTLTMNVQTVSKTGTVMGPLVLEKQ